MSAHTTTIGYIAVICFLVFTGIGACAQVYKLIKRTRAWKSGTLGRDRICDGLHPVREMWSFSAFLLFALSGLTRTHLDYFLLLSRLPVIVLSTIILWFLQSHGITGAKRFFFVALGGNVVLVVLIALAVAGGRFDHSFIPWIVDGALSIVSLLLFYGKHYKLSLCIVSGAHKPSRGYVRVVLSSRI